MTIPNPCRIHDRHLPRILLHQQRERVVPHPHDKFDVMLVDRLIQLVRLRRMDEPLRRVISLRFPFVRRLPAQRAGSRTRGGALDLPGLLLEGLGELTLAPELAVLFVELEFGLGEGFAMQGEGRGERGEEDGGGLEAWGTGEGNDGWGVYRWGMEGGEDVRVVVRHDLYEGDAREAPTKR